MRPYDLIRAGAAALLVALPGPAAAQQAPAATFRDATYTIFVRAASVGTEQIGSVRTADGWTIVSTGRMNAPINVVLRRLELKYDADWKPLEMSLDATLRGQEQSFRTVRRESVITTQITIAGQAPTTSTATADADIFLPNPFFAPFEAISHRLLTATPGTTWTAFIPPQTPASFVVGESSTERFETPLETIDARRTHITVTPLLIGGTPVDADVWSDANGRLLRVRVPAQALEVMREDLSSVVARQVPVSRPNDEQIKIPSIGFTLAGTISKPSAASGRAPAAVLVGGSGTPDRDEMIAGIPVLGQLANALADAGVVTLRYDRRGGGQSGGRPESSTLSDYADDVRTAVKILSGRSDVDPKRIVVIGHAEGGAVALLAASKERKIAGVVLLAMAGVRGTDHVLEQQERALGRLSLSDTDRQARIDLQRKINQAVLTGKGMTQLPAQVQRQVDTLEYQSVLNYDPATVMPKVRQPILIVQGELDAQVAPINAERLERLAATRKNAAPVQVKRLPGINHLLVPAGTGEVEEYAVLRDRRIAQDVPAAIVQWQQSIVVK